MAHPLRDYIIRRLLIIIPTLLGVSIITFTIIHLAPGGPLQFFLGGMRGDVDPRAIEEIKQQLGLDKPIWEQYLIWIALLIKGDLGYSFVSYQPVSALIGERVINTLKLTLTSLLVSLVIAIPLGILSAVKRYTIFDNISRVFSLLGVSMPSFWFGLLLIYVFAVYLDWFPAIGTVDVGNMTIENQLWHMVLPVTTLSIINIAFINRLARSSMLDVLQQDYIRTARSVGLKERVVIYKYALKNGVLPIITVVGLNVGFLLAGAVLVEVIFAWPGMGRLIVFSAFNRDYPVIMGITMIISLMVVLANLAADIAYALVDPRVRYVKK